MHSTLSNKRLQQWDELIQLGQVSTVRKEFKALNFKRIPRNQLTNYANIARRIGLPNLILLLLNPIIRSDKKLEQKASLQEKAIYGLGLLRVGAFNEAEKIFNTLDPKKEPQIYFYKASLYINQWHYKKAIPLLKYYIKNPKISNYQKLVGSINLCASYVALKNEQLAEKHIARLYRKLKNSEHKLLLGNLLEIRAQWHSDQGHSAQVIADLELSKELLKMTDEGSQLYITKWQILSRLKSNPTNKKELQQLEDLKQQAIKYKEWELLRDCDFYLSLYQKNKQLLAKVYWGTLFPEYKKRVLKLSGFSLETADFFYWENHDTLTTPETDLVAFDLVAKAPSKLLKSLFFMLTQEFYRPLRLTEIFGVIYPEEFYHPIHSTLKIRRLIHRARKWLSNYTKAIEIKNLRGFYYKLEFSKHLKLKVYKSFPLGAPSFLSQELVTSYSIPKNFFSSKELSKTMKLSQRS
ncbi:MAG: hypothetical protein L6Q37_11390, partial [Bdellovibrionaceae bacterium]|nr:hypothetical protein [Pseudobdellovibrionaceae bacterium]